jgi:hypothetical protein
MPARPIHTKGKLHLIESSWHVVLDNAHPSFEEGMTAELVLWDSRSEGGRSEVEEIARVQQLEPAIVALGLASEGALGGTDFGERLKIQL